MTDANATSGASPQGGSVFRSGAPVGFMGFSFGPTPTAQPPTPVEGGPVAIATSANPPTPAAAATQRGSTSTVFGAAPFTFGPQGGFSFGPPAVKSIPSDSNGDNGPPSTTLLSEDGAETASHPSSQLVIVPKAIPRTKKRYVPLSRHEGEKPVESRSDVAEVRTSPQREELECQNPVKQALSVADLEELVGNESAPVWGNEKQSFLLPWEAALLTMLVAGRESRSRCDVPLTLTMCKSISISREMRSCRPYVTFHGSSLGVCRPRDTFKDTPFRVEAGEESLPWTYGWKFSDGCGTGVGLLQAARNPGLANTGSCAQIGTLPAKELLIANVDEVVAKSLSGDQFDIFCIAVACRRRMAEGIAKSFFSFQRTTIGPGPNLYNLARTTNPDQYLAVLGGVEDFLNPAHPLKCLAQAAPHPELLRTVFKALIAQGLDLRKAVGDASVPIHRPTMVVRPSFDSLVGGRFTSEIAWEVLPNLYHLLKAIKSLWLDSARSFVEVLQRASVTNIFLSAEDHADLLLDSITFQDRMDDRRLSTAEGEAKLLNELKFVVEETSALGFDLKVATQQLLETGRFPGSVPFALLRYIFVVHLGLEETKELLKPRHYAAVFRTAPRLRFALEELGLLVPEPSSPECGAMLVGALRSFDHLPGASYLLAQCPPGELGEPARTQCLELLCSLSDVRPGEIDLKMDILAELLHLFHQRGWVGKNFRFPNGEGLQHRMQFGIRRSFPINLPPEPLQTIPVIDVLAKEIGFDFAEANTDGEFPLSLAIMRSGPLVVLYLLQDGLAPSKEVLLNYRHRRQPEETLLTLLFRAELSLYGYPSEIHRMERIGSCCRGVCERIGLDVVRALGKLECKFSHPDESSKKSSLPLALACLYWRLEDVQYLVEDVGIEGSEPGSPSMLKVLNCLSVVPKRPTTKYLQQRSAAGSPSLSSTVAILQVPA